MKPRALILTILLLPAFGAAATRPSTAIESASCVTVDCHANIKSSPALHGPIADDSCEICHETIRATTHTYRLRRAGAELCTYCHEFNVAAMPVIHKPVELGECLGCHNPHGGRDRTFTRESSMKSLCYRCHETAPSDHQVLHTPVSQGQCTSCHSPHAAMFPKLLDAVGSDLCLACHDKLDRSLTVVRLRHPALDKGCDQCHDPHGSSEPMQLVQPTAELCQGCHENVKQRIAVAKFRHSAATSGRACLSCHTPHGSDATALLTDQPVTLCMGCHKNSIKLTDGRTVLALSDLTRVAMHKHGAINDGECSGCHDAHGTAEPMLLTKPYSTAIYQPSSLSQFELCFSCHDTRLLQSSSAAGITRFRNGDRNLHWVHVKEGERGRSCAMCHTTHASENERNIRDTVPFKLWKMPIRFVASDTGGSCAPGCHVPWVYDRDQPVVSATTLPAEIPDAAPKRRQAQQPVMITLNARDTKDRQVRIPASQPSVIVFTRDDPAQAVEILRLIESGITDAKASVIVVMSGPQASLRADALSGEEVHVIADPDCRLADQLQVHGWPMTLVVQADGMKVIDFVGAGRSLPLKLGPYLQLAAGTLDRAAVERILSHPVIARDGKPNLPMRNLREARRLLNEHRPAEAVGLLAESLKVEPDSLPLRVELIRALLALDRPDDALAALQSLDAVRLPPGEHDLLRARALLGKYRWVDAKNLLIEIVRDHSNLEEAHYLLGSLYERDGQWQKAAEEYRAASQARRSPSK